MKRFISIIVFCLLVSGILGLPAADTLTFERAELERIATKHFGDEFLLRAADYQRMRVTLFLGQVLMLFCLLGWWVTGSLGKWGQAAVFLAGRRIWLARLFALTAVYLGLAVVRVPFAIGRFFLAREYGLRHDSFFDFAVDWFKALGIGWAIVAMAGLVILTLFAVLPRCWLWVSIIAVSLLAVGYITAAPVIIDPLFNQFRKLDDEKLERRLLDLSRMGGVSANKILIADASRRSHAVNAYFTGIGDTQRIVLYDTLVNNFDIDEIEVVLAHELGHVRERHIHKGLFLGMVGIFLAFVIAGRVLGWFVSRRIGGLSGRDDPALAIPAYALYMILMLLAIVPSNWVSRQMEAEADQFALELIRDPDTFIRTETRIARGNLSNVLPPAWIEFVFYTHPAITRRILLAENFK